MYTVEFDPNEPKNSVIRFSEGQDNKIEFNFKYENIIITQYSSYLTKEAIACMKQFNVTSINNNLSASFSITKGDTEGTFSFFDVSTLLLDDDFIETIKTIYYSYRRAKILEYVRSKTFYTDCQANNHKTMYIYDYANGNKKPVATMVVFDNIRGIIDVGISICNEVDPFVKETGVKVAVNNLLNGLKPHRKNNRKITLENGKIVRLAEYLRLLEYKLIHDRQFNIFVNG